MAWSDAARAAAAETRRRNKKSSAYTNKRVDAFDKMMGRTRPSNVAKTTFAQDIRDSGFKNRSPITRFKAGGSGVTGGVKRMLGYSK